MDQKKMGRFLKELRREKGVTQEQLSEILGVTSRSISRWENGVNMPDFDLIIEIANYYDVSIDELLDAERKNEMVDKKTEETILKVADYKNDEKMILSKRMRVLFLLAVGALAVYMVIEQMGLSGTGVYEDIASAALGLVLGILLAGVLYTTPYIWKVKAFKQRVFGRRGE